MRTDHHVESDTALLVLLDSDPETGMEELVTRYNGLLWSVAARRLGEPEDIKDCINETFLEFYAHRERFAPDKGSLKSYLSAITDRLALKRYRELSRCAAGATEEMPDCRDAIASADSRADLESALEQLEPLDAEIIRMKYYGGMTFKEIAASLDIPYETAKKRHQRSLKKLRKSMIIGMVVILLAALLAACAYVVLRYFGVVPGYGVNNDPETGIYILEEPALLEMEDRTLTITDCWWNDGLLILQYSVEAPGQTADSIEALVDNLGLSHFALEGLDDFSYLGSSRSIVDDQHAEGELYARGGLPEGTGDILELQLMSAVSPIPLPLRRAETEVSFDQAGYYDLTEDQGGLLATPRLENGELIVSIYPLNGGDFTIDAGLTKLCGELAPVTVTAGDGTVLTGSPVRRSTWNSSCWRSPTRRPGGSIRHRAACWWAVTRGSMRCMLTSIPIFSTVGTTNL